HNHYGPSETHVITTLTLDPREDIPELPSIGGPIANTHIYILDKSAHLVPAGVVGELCVSGAQVGRGYLGKDELTSEGFLDKSFSGGPGGRFFKKAPLAAGGRFYRTGDLARWLPDGNIQFLGREDHQVKIRGFRVELEEIEIKLVNHDRVKEVVVIAREDDKKDKYLYAYIVPVSGDVDEFASFTGELREYLSRLLPDYMIPSYFVPMEKIPVAATGKVDRRSLPVPDTTLTGAYIPPGDDLERQLAGIWSDVLGTSRERTGIHDNFFQSGGHSLRATVLMSRIHKAIDVKVSLLEIFQKPTIAGLAELIRGRVPGNFVEIGALEKKEYYDTTYAQQRVWVLSRIKEASLAFNMPAAFKMEGELNIGAFEKTFAVLLERHESLRTVFLLVGDTLKQKVLSPPEMDFKLEIIDLWGYDSGGGAEEINRLMEEMSGTPFDLSRGPLLTAALLRLGEKETLFLFNIHHIISDLLTSAVLTREITVLYNAYRLGQPNPLLPLRIHYKDYAVWRNRQLSGDYLQRLREYWLERFRNMPHALKLPLDKPRPLTQSFRGDQVITNIDQSLTGRLRRLSGESGVTLFMIFLAALDALLYHYTGQTDMVTGTVVSGREHTDLEDQVGFYLNTLALRTRFSEYETFSRLLQRVKEITLGAFEHQSYPFDMLVADLEIPRDGGRSPLFDVMIDMINPVTPVARQESNRDLRVLPVDTGHKRSKFDLTVYITEQSDTLQLLLEYNTDLFEKDSIQWMSKRFLALLKRIVESPDTPVADLELEEAFRKEMPAVKPRGRERRRR
ncbi:MAG: AMP-binding protein, partial [bacterium]|nr:AMP-binding protein [bacterium]